MEFNFREALAALVLYKGRIFGVIFGGMIGLVTAKYGFKAGLFFTICVFVGYFIGKRVDHKDSFRDIVERILPPVD